MKKLSIVMFLFFMLSACSQKPGYVVEKIEDGDTIVVKIDGQSKRIQLSGIDAPEDTVNPKFKLDLKTRGLNKQELLGLGNAASAFLKSQLAAGEQVTFKDKLGQPDKYGRIPAIVFLHGESINQRMVRQGYAVVLDRYPLQPSFKKALKSAENLAYTNKQGLWKKSPETMAKWVAKPAKK